MSEEKGVDKFVNDVMSSLEGIETTKPSPFFYTRVKSRLESKQSPADGLDWFNQLYTSKWSVAVAGLLLLINLGVILFSYDQGTSPIGQSANMEVLIDEYQLEYNTLYSYIDE